MDGEAKKPEKLTENHLKFLDDLRESGATNMFGATPYLRRRFRDLSDHEAGEVLVYWMKTFAQRHPDAN